jgi:hypothetical protein
MNEHDIESMILDLQFETDHPTATEIAHSTSFEGAGVLTHNRGVVLRMNDGSEFQITIVQSAPPRRGQSDPTNRESGEGDQ